VREHDDPKSGVPTAVSTNAITEEHMGVIIGVDPHKGSHTAVAIGRDEVRLAKVKVRATRRQVDQLLEWAAPFEERTWAIESAGGLGYLLAQQLLNAGEQVLDVPATLAARVRVLGTGRSNKNDPNDAHSVAMAALRAPRLSSVARADHAGVLRLLAKRNNELGRARNKTACRLHALLAELVPGGIPNEINAASAERTLAGVKPASPVEVARHVLALEHLDDLRRLDAQMRISKARIAEAIAASGTSLTELFGVGPVVAAMLIGYTGDVARFRNRDHFAAWERLCNPAWPAPHPSGRLFGSATPGPEPTLEPVAPRGERRRHHAPETHARSSLDSKEEFDMSAARRRASVVVDVRSVRGDDRTTARQCRIASASLGQRFGGRRGVGGRRFQRRG
jgi:transposase